MKRLWGILGVMIIFLLIFYGCSGVTGGTQQDESSQDSSNDSQTTLSLIEEKRVDFPEGFSFGAAFTNEETLYAAFKDTNNGKVVLYEIDLTNPESSKVLDDTIPVGEYDVILGVGASNDYVWVAYFNYTDDIGSYGDFKLKVYDLTNNSSSTHNLSQLCTGDITSKPSYYDYSPSKIVFLSANPNGNKICGVTISTGDTGSVEISVTDNVDFNYNLDTLSLLDNTIYGAGGDENGNNFIFKIEGNNLYKSQDFSGSVGSNITEHSGWLYFGGYGGDFNDIGYNLYKLDSGVSNQNVTFEAYVSANDSNLNLNDITGDSYIISYGQKIWVFFEGFYVGAIANFGVICYMVYDPVSGEIVKVGRALPFGGDYFSDNASYYYANLDYPKMPVGWGVDSSGRLWVHIFNQDTAFEPYYESSYIAVYNTNGELLASHYIVSNAHFGYFRLTKINGEDRGILIWKEETSVVPKTHLSIIKLIEE